MNCHELQCITIATTLPINSSKIKMRDKNIMKSAINYKLSISNRFTIHEASNSLIVNQKSVYYHQISVHFTMKAHNMPLFYDLLIIFGTSTNRRLRFDLLSFKVIKLISQRHDILEPTLIIILRKLLIGYLLMFVL